MQRQRIVGCSALRKILVSGGLAARCPSCQTTHRERVLPQQQNGRPVWLTGPRGAPGETGSPWVRFSFVVSGFRLCTHMSVPVSFVFCPPPPPPRTAPPCCTPGHRLSVSYQPCSVLCGLGLCRSQPWLEGLYAALSVNICVHPGAPCSPSRGSARLVSVYALLVLACVGDICGRLFADDKCH